MKKTMRTLLALVLLLSLVLGTVSAASAKGFIGMKKAREIALADAGCKRSEVIISRAKLYNDEELGKVYEIEFYKKENHAEQYDYTIDAKTGEILAKDNEAESYKPKPIGKPRARNIALKDAGLTMRQVTQMKVQLIRENGKVFYIVTFYQKGPERFFYEYRIDGVSGEILERVRVETRGFISPKEAKLAVLKHLGLRQNQVRSMKVVLDAKVPCYVVTFRKKGEQKVYEYKVDPQGQILREEPESGT